MNPTTLDRAVRTFLRPSVACAVSIIALALAGSACSSTGSASRTPPLSSVVKPSSEPSTATAAAISSIPPVAVIRMVNGILVSPGDELDPLPYGSEVPVSELQPPVMVGGGVGFALTATDSSEGYLYPARTTDGGATWQIDGAWFGNPTADAGAFVDTIGGASSQVAWAWNSRPSDPEGPLYTTMDGGLEWYQTAWQGIVKSISQGSNGELVARVAPMTFEVNHRMVPSGSPGVYTSANGGSTWEFAGAY